MTPEIEKLLNALECPEHERFWRLDPRRIVFKTANGNISINVLVERILKRRSKHISFILESACAIARCHFRNKCRDLAEQEGMLIPALNADRQEETWRNLWNAVEGEGKES
jgi:hypothetical protein